MLRISANSCMNAEISYSIKIELRSIARYSHEMLRISANSCMYVEISYSIKNGSAAPDHAVSAVFSSIRIGVLLRFFLIRHMSDQPNLCMQFLFLT